MLLFYSYCKLHRLQKQIAYTDGIFVRRTPAEYILITSVSDLHVQPKLDMHPLP